MWIGMGLSWGLVGGVRGREDAKKMLFGGARGIASNIIINNNKDEYVLSLYRFEFKKSRTW